MALPPVDLSDADLRELDDLLASVPAPWEALDVVMLDGYLCGLLVQPVPPEPEAWWPPVFGEHEAPFGPDAPGWHPAKHERLTQLVTRRLAVIERGLREDSWFDPIVPAEEPGGKPFEGVGFWVAGFEWALVHFNSLEDARLPGVADLLESLWRHLPEQDETQAAMTQALNLEHPLRTLDQAIEQLVFDVADLHDLALQERLKVTTVRREAPKVGRNDPCPCGSGRKYKACHGASV